MSGRALRQFPSGSQYVDALQNTQLCFDDPVLKGAVPDRDKLGRPRPISGNFASVFGLTSPSGEKYAVKCFTRDVPDQERRYQAISNHLAGLCYPWQVGFDYLPQGILVEGTRYPLLRMQWVRGTGLARWIDGHLSDQAALRKVTENFATLIDDLSSSSIGHGDLQHGNLLVADDGSLRLVDYDGMYVPALAGLAPSENGHRNYQSPLRTATDFGPEIDRFSAWVIYLSLVAVAVEPSLWHQLHEQDGEYLLLAEEDFKDPTASARFLTLVAHDSPEVSDLAQQVRKLAAAPITAQAPLERTALVVPVPAAAVPTVYPPRPGLPSWMAGHIQTAPAQPPVRFEHTNRVLSRSFAVLTIILPFLLLLFAAATSLQAVAVFGAVSTTGLSYAFVRYRCRPELRDARAARVHTTSVAREERKITTSLSELERRKTSLDSQETRTKSDFSSRNQLLMAQYQQQKNNLSRDLQRTFSEIDAQIADLRNRRQKELTRAIEDHSAVSVRAYLAKRQVAYTALDGIGPTLIANLRAAGISTAADFTGITFTSGSGRYSTRIAMFKLTSGGRVRVTGIGEVKAQRLNDWRKGHEQEAKRIAAASFPAAARQQVEVRYQQLEQNLKAKRTTAEQDLRDRQAALNRQLSDEQVKLTRDQQTALSMLSGQRATLNQTMAQARAASNATTDALAQAQVEAQRYSQITFSHYLRSALFG